MVTTTSLLFLFRSLELDALDPHSCVVKYASTIWRACVSANKGVDAEAVLKCMIGPNAFDDHNTRLLVGGNFDMDDDFATSISNPDLTSVC